LPQFFIGWIYVKCSTGPMPADYQRHIFPAALVLLNLGAAAMSFKGGDVRRGVYWLASGLCVAMAALAK
jgi:hypothetical protein